MFRKMRRFKQQLTLEQCIEILKKEPRGVLSVHGEDGYPYGMPMNQYYDEDENKLYFHSAKEGHKLDALLKNEKVSFCVYDQGFRREGEWALNIQSVIVFGKIHLITDPNIVLEKIRQLGLKHYPTPEAVEEEIKKSVDRVQMLELTIEHITGKLVNES